MSRIVLFVIFFALLHIPSLYAQNNSAADSPSLRQPTEADYEAANINKTVLFITETQAARTIFQDRFHYPPGENPAGNSNLKLQFWSDLQNAGLLQGYNSSSHEPVWGQAFPASPLGGGFLVLRYDGAVALPGTFAGAKPMDGLYLLLTNEESGDLSTSNSYILTSERARKLDEKLDDGSPLTGAVIAAGDPECLDQQGGYLSYKKFAPGTEDDMKKCFALYINISH